MGATHSKVHLPSGGLVTSSPSPSSEGGEDRQEEERQEGRADDKDVRKVPEEKEREKERLSGLYLETEFGEERRAGGWDPPPHRTPESRAAVKHSGARSLSASATRTKHQIAACWLVRGGLWPFISVMAECICPCSYVLSEAVSRCLHCSQMRVTPSYLAGSVFW